MQGDIYASGVQTINAGEYHNLIPNPTIGSEIVIHNIHAYCEQGAIAELQYFDSTTGKAITVDVPTVNPASWMGLNLHCTATRYYRVYGNYNQGPVTFTASADGVYTK